MERHVEEIPAPTEPFASLVINQVMDADDGILGYIFVMNPDRPDPKWKFAGGHSEPGETPLEAAMRENQGETGLRLLREAYTQIDKASEWRPRPTGHWSHLFVAKVSIDQIRLVNEHDIGNEGEIVRYFTLAELEVEIRLGTILGAHLRKMMWAVPNIS
ncbi:NUDIX hydrolase [Patescibacteria group bacterium]|nr:NUDIX hydrolase [Patescibacteria group bacterium]